MTTAVVGRIPPEAKAHTKKGGEAFARYYFEQANKAFVTLDTSVVEVLAEPGCKTCAALVEGVEAYRAQGIHNLRQNFVFESSNVRPGQPNDRFNVELVGHETPVTKVDSKGNVVGTTKPNGGWLRLTVQWRQTHWTIVEIASVKK